MMTDKGLLAQTEALVAQAGALLLARFDRGARPGDLADIGARIAANDALVMDLMREGLAAILPGSRLIEDELAEGRLGAGDAWIVDPVEGAINHIHGMDDWCVTATLMRDDRPYLTVVHLPLQGQTYTALAGQRAWLNGVALRVSAKQDLDAAMVGTGQAAPGERPGAGADRGFGRRHAGPCADGARLGARHIAADPGRGRADGGLLAVQPGAFGPRLRGAFGARGRGGR